MLKVISVSFPRSGHHLVERCLRGIFPGEIAYCDFYKHCQHSPCTDPKTTLQKCHDFDLRLRRVSGWVYLIQFRHPIEAIASWYEAELRHRHKPRIGESAIKKSLKMAFLKDTEGYWRLFLGKNLAYWRNFVRKWALNPRQEDLLLPYAELVDDPILQLSRLADVLGGDFRPDRAKIEEVIRDQRIAKRRSIREFRYFAPDRFRAVERRVEVELTALGIPLQFS